MADRTSSIDRCRRRRRRLRDVGCALICVSALALAAAASGAEPTFGDALVPSSGPAAAIGGYSRGCLAGGMMLPADGPGWQVMRPSRNRAYGHPQLIAFIRSFAESARTQGWPGLLVGDLAQPRGGPMSSGHDSHQIGLDVDIWLTPASPQRFSPAERDSVSAVSMVRADGTNVDTDRWTRGHVMLLRTAAEYPQVDRIFVNPAIKRALCHQVAGDRAWLAKIRPWWGHDHHMHVRLRCPNDQALCINQPPIPATDECGSELDWWFSAEAKEELARRRETPSRKPTLADLPPACRAVLFGS